MSTVKFRTAYDGVRVAVGLTFVKPTLTVQYEKDMCDINRIMAKYQKTGLIDHVSRYQGQYADVANTPTYQEAMQTIINANAAFQSLPSAIRDRFANDPARFLEFVHNPENKDEMARMGLLKVKEDPVYPVVRIFKDEKNEGEKGEQ
jgi:phage internal scaffolding protein